MTAAEVAILFNLVIGILAAAAGIYATRVAKRGRDREVAQQQAMTAEAKEQSDRRQRFTELQASLKAAREDLAYFREQVNTARSELARVTEQRDARIKDLERRVEGLESDKDEAFEQADLLAKQLDEERETNKLLRAQLTATLAELDVAKQQIVILTEHARRVDDWWHLFAREHGNPNNAPEPPKLTTFDAEN